MKKLITGVAALAMMPMASVAQEDVAPALNYVDVNGDGVVTETEFVSRLNALFDELDTSGDSAINFSEASVTMTRDLFDGADTDGSGWISRAEYEAQVRRDFATADIDNDGTLE